NSSNSSLSSFQRLLLHTVAECDISAQETCYLLLGISLYHFSRQFVTLNLNRKTPRWFCGTESKNFVPTSKVGQTEKLPLQKLCNGQWKKYECENIVRIWTKLSSQCNSSQWEEFCHIKVMLHVCHRSLQQLTEN
ncbi:10654_t:CDS:2, partial [Racocetra persica]